MIRPKEAKFSEEMFFVAILVLVGYYVITKRELLDFVFLAFISLDFVRYYIIRRKECSKI